MSLTEPISSSRCRNGDTGRNKEAEDRCNHICLLYAQVSFECLDNSIPSKIVERPFKDTKPK